MTGPRFHYRTDVPSPRELEILTLIAEGLTNVEIGERLHLSKETIKSHVKNMLFKMDARSRAHAVALAYQRELLPLVAA